ncbi:MAG TPA: L-rhamnose mutarotase [Thermoguttaceae bacterium]|nr:L-rhamnose mutarotase [Thermoguttaceae bacterium]
MQLVHNQLVHNGFSRLAAAAVTLFVGALIGFGCSESAHQGDDRAAANETPAATGTIQRFGSVIGLKAEKQDYYNQLHAKPWPEINALLKKAHIQNYTIYEVELDGKLYLFAYFEYSGEDFDADMALMAENPKVIQWWAETDPCQIKLPGTPEDEQWLGMKAVYHLD